MTVAISSVIPEREHMSVSGIQIKYCVYFLLDPRIRGDDTHFEVAVIPANAGIQ